MPSVTHFPPGFFGPISALPLPVPLSTSGSYAYLTFSGARDELAARLGDPNKVFWTDMELSDYLKEALRQWSLLSGYYKDKAVFSTTVNSPYYSLATEVPDLRGYSVTDTEVIRLVQFSLMEPAPGISWDGSEQFTYEIVLASLNRRLNRLLLETGVTLQQDLFISDSPPVATLQLFDDIIDIRRVAWVGTERTITLRQKDPLARRSFDPRAAYTPRTPISYLRANKPHVTMELSPPAADAGSLDVISCRTGGTKDGQGNTLGIPDDLTPTLKWGILADLLNTEKAYDSERAEYCERRWEEGVQAVRLYPAVWSMEVNGQPVTTSSLEELDSFKPNWQNDATGIPVQVAAAGLDLLALSPIPDNTHAITAEVTRRAIVPAADSDFIQIGREHLDIIYDYCVHLATFKQGGDMFASTKPQLESFYAAATAYNDRLKAEAFYKEAMDQQSHRENKRRPRQEGE